MTIQTMTNAPDKILDEMTRLGTMNIIEDIKEHVEAWRNLAIVATLEGRMYTAMNCLARAEYWLEQVPCIRLVEGSFSELIPLDAEPEHKTDEVQGVYAWQEQTGMD